MFTNAIYNGDIYTIRQCVELGADVRGADENGATHVHSNGHAELVAEFGHSHTCTLRGTFIPSGCSLSWEHRLMLLIILARLLCS
jgi:hypothetical protein